MKCPECDGFISSPFLVEMGSVTCNQCEENVTVKDVFVTTKVFTMYRETLLERVLHYRSLLEEVEREKKSFGNGDVPSTVDQQNLDQSYAALRGIVGCFKGKLPTGNL